MFFCGIVIEFDSAHRLYRYSGKCEKLHGHRYKVEFEFESSTGLDDDGMVIDFTDIKPLLKKWIDVNLDHNVILGIEDKKLGEAIEDTTGYKIYWMQDNPTAENIAKLLIDKANELLQNNHQNVECVRVKVFETPNGWGEVRISSNKNH